MSDSSNNGIPPSAPRAPQSIPAEDRTPKKTTAHKKITLPATGTSEPLDELTLDSIPGAAAAAASVARPELSLPLSDSHRPVAPPSSPRKRTPTRNAILVFTEMEEDFSTDLVRPWVPTSIPSDDVSGSIFSQWAANPTSLEPLLSPETSASCFEIFLLFAARGEVLSPPQVQWFFQSVDEKLASVPRFRRASTWFRAWLGKLAGSKKNRVNYIRAPRPAYNSDLDWGEERRVDDQGERSFPAQGDIVFFNPINNRPNRHFDHVALATGRELTRRELTGNPRDDDAHLETEILSFYGRGAGQDALIERTTIEQMLDTHSLIRRSPPEGGDRQVFFAPPPWSSDTMMGKLDRLA